MVKHTKAPLARGLGRTVDDVSLSNLVYGKPLYADFTFAYQPIVNVDNKTVVSYEALVRGPNNEPAPAVLASLPESGAHRFDIDAREGAISLAVKLGLKTRLNLNLLPANLETHGLDVMEQTMLSAAKYGLRAQQVVLEVSEAETITSYARFVERVNHCRSLGASFAIDDFGAGYSGLNLLAEFQPDSIKLDMMLVRDIDSRGPRQAIIRGIVRTCEDLGIDIVAEGVETYEEYEWLTGEGIILYQGYYFAKPGFQALPVPTFPA